MRILFVKTSSLGDVVHHCPAVTDVRRRFPDAVIDWVVEETFAGIVALHPAVRKTIPVAVRRWRKGAFLPAVWKEMFAFHRLLRAEHYDFVIDTQGLLKSALIAASAHGFRCGFDADSAREPIASLFYQVSQSVPREMHAVERNRILTAKVLDLESTGRCDYGLVSRGEGPISLKMPYCVLLSMTSRADKLWPEERWAELARELATRGCESVLPWGNEFERARCRRIVGLAGSGVVPRSLALDELASLMTQARSVIGVDTGLTHLAAALNVPAIGLFVPTDPRLTGLYGAGKMANLGGLWKVPTVGDTLEALGAIT
jgi:heptosyltransferase-1